MRLERGFHWTENFCSKIVALGLGQMRVGCLKALIALLKSRPPVDRHSPKILMLFVYLVDWAYSSYSPDGEAYTGTQWVLDKGPYSPEVAKVILELSNTPKVEMPLPDDTLLMEVLDYLIPKFRDRSFWDILEFTYATPPVRKTISMGESLYLTRPTIHF